MPRALHGSRVSVVGMDCWCPPIGSLRQPVEDALDPLGELADEAWIENCQHGTTPSVSLVVEFFRRPRWSSFTGLYELRRVVCHGVPGFLLVQHWKDDAKGVGRSVVRAGCQRATKSPKQYASGSSRVSRFGGR